VVHAEVIYRGQTGQASELTVSWRLESADSSCYLAVTSDNRITHGRLYVHRSHSDLESVYISETVPAICSYKL
jgi:hypothetical protein